jgi:hypothetical protein
VNNTVFLLLKILWTFIRAMIMCLQVGLSFLGISAEAPLSPSLTFYDGLFAMALLLLVMIQQFNANKTFRKIVVLAMAVDLAALLLLFYTVLPWPFITILMCILILLQGFIIFRLRKDRSPHAVQP